VSEPLAAERSWVWTNGLPLDRYRGPIELFWRGLGYDAAWNGPTLNGSRDLNGQRREFAVEIGAPESGRVRVHCRVTFVGVPSSTRPGELLDPAQLAIKLGEALARGFGPSTAPG